MNLAHVPLSLSFALALSAAVPAQRTWIVDTDGGGDFLDLPPAVQAANSGDTILVQGRSSFRGTTIDKGLTILRDVAAGAGPLGLTVVENLQPHEKVVLGNFKTTFFVEPQMALWIRDCRGQVHLGELRFPTSGEGIQTRSFIRIEDCASVTLHNCAVLDMTVRRSTVLCTFTGISGDGFPRSTRAFGYPGIDCEDSDVTLAQCGVTGGISFGEPPSIPGIQMLRGRLVITAVHTGTFGFVRGGATWDSQNRRWLDGPAIHSDGGVVEIDPAVSLFTRNGLSPLTTGTSRFVYRQIPFLRIQDRSPGRSGTLDVRAYGPPGAAAGVFVSVAVQPLPSVFGNLWVDPASMLLMGVGTIPATGPLTISEPINNCCPQGTGLAVQGIVLDPTTFWLTTPVVAFLY